MSAPQTAIRPRILASLTAAAVVAIFATACSSNSNTGFVGSPGILTILAGDDINETVGDQVGPFSVKVTDTSGTALPNVQVHFVASSGLTLASSTDTTGSDGSTFTSGTLTTVSGLDSIIATVSGISAPVVFHITANPDVASIFAVASGNNQLGPAGTPLTEALAVRVSDKYNNPIPGVQVNWSSQRGTLATSSGMTNMTGVSQNTYTLPIVAGAQTITATATVGSTIMTVTFDATAN